MPRSTLSHTGVFLPLPDDTPFLALTGGTELVGEFLLLPSTKISPSAGDVASSSKSCARLQSGRMLQAKQNYTYFFQIKILIFLKKLSMSNVIFRECCQIRLKTQRNLDLTSIKEVDQSNKYKK